MSQLRRFPQPSLDDQAALLGEVPLFSNLTSEYRKRLAGRGRTKALPADNVVFHEGDKAEHLLVILDGSVKVFLSGSEGEEISLGTLGRAGMCGEMALLDDKPRSASVKTLEHTSFLELGRQAVEEAVRANPDIALMMMRHLAGMLRSANAQIRTLSTPNADLKVLRALLGLADKKATGGAREFVVSPRPTNQHLAERIACRPETVSRAIAELCRADDLTIGKTGIRITQRALEKHGASLQDLF